MTTSKRVLELKLTQPQSKTARPRGSFEESGRIQKPLSVLRADGLFQKSEFAVEVTQ